MLEVLVAIAVVAAVVGIGSQMIIGSLRSSKISNERNAALGLVEETFEAVRNSSSERWQNIYDLTKDSVQYYPQQFSGKWQVAAGTENIVINSIAYTRYFTVSNVSRDPTTRDIENTYNAGNNDPSTQKIFVTVSWPNADAITSSEYTTRWRNKACLQTSWQSAGSGTSTCPTSNYGSVINITPGENLQLCVGGC